MTQNYSGGAASFLGGIGDALLSPLDPLSGCATCSHEMLGGHLGLPAGSYAMGGGSITGEFTAWLHHQGVPTGPGSWFDAGIGTAIEIGIMLGMTAGPAPEMALNSARQAAPRVLPGAIRQLTWQQLRSFAVKAGKLAAKNYFLSTLDRTAGQVCASNGPPVLQLGPFVFGLRAPSLGVFTAALGPWERKRRIGLSSPPGCLPTAFHLPVEADFARF